MVYAYLVYSVYLLLLFIVLFTKAATYHAISLNPFDFLTNNPRILSEAFLNIVYFIPLGVLYGLKANWRQTCAIALITILGIETLQYAFYLGTFAISDILLNFSGCLLGFKLQAMLETHFKHV